MSYFHKRHSIFMAMIALCLTIFTACSSDNSATTPTKIPVTVVSTVEVVTVTTSTSTIGTGPIIILSPTPVPNGGANSQQVVLADRTLIVNSVVKAAGSNTNTTITLSLTLKNTGTHTFTNEPAYFSLLNSEGSVFGLAANAQGSFFGSIGVGSSRSGSLIFQVTTNATSSLKLFYNPGTANDTVFLPLPV